MPIEPLHRTLALRKAPEHTSHCDLPPASTCHLPPAQGALWVGWGREHPDASRAPTRSSPT
eukprot:7152354-Lingulodinium_polyedra.AAC.1